MMATSSYAGAPNSTAPNKATAASALQGSAAPFNWSHVPHELIPSILQHVSLDHRFSACALVSKAWAAAVASMPVTTVSTSRRSGKALQRSWDYLRLKFGPDVMLLSLRQSRRSVNQYPTLQLPPGVLDLSLQHVAVELGQQPSHTASSIAELPPLGPLSALTALTKLSMQGVVLLGHWGDVDCLTALSNLQHLHAQDVQHASAIKYALNTNHMENSGSPLLSRGILPKLPQLTYLHVDGGRLCPAVSAAGLREITFLTQLQHLGVSLEKQVLGGYSDDGAEEPYILDLPAGICGLTQLTYLKITSFYGRSLPNLAPLAALQHLELSLCGKLQGAAMTELTGLRHLRLDDFSIPDCDDHVAFWIWLQQGFMTSLFLKPDYHSYYWGGGLGPPAGWTAGSKLQRLTLWDTHLSERVWERIFPAGQLLPALTYLGIFCNYGPASCDTWKHMVAACPSLQQLELDVSCLPEGPQATDQMPKSELLPLTALTSLTLSPLPAEHVPHFALLTGLQELDLSSSSIQESDLKWLVSLSELTHLAVGGDCWNRNWCPSHNVSGLCLNLFTKRSTFSSACDVSVIAQLRQHLDKWDKERTAAWQHRGNPSAMQDELQHLGLLEDHKRGPEGRRCKSSNSPFPWPSKR